MALTGILGAAAAVAADATDNGLIIGVPLVVGLWGVCWAMRARVRDHWRSVALCAAFYGLYSVLRDRLVGDPRVLALRHAHTVIGLERSLHVYVEPWAAREWATLPAGILGAADSFYADFNTVGTVLCFCFLAVRFGPRFNHWRNVLAVASISGLAVFWLYPVAPPRFVVGYGFVDHIAPGLDRFALVDAAFPSFHTMWAAWVATALISLGVGGRARWVWTGYPVVTAVVIVGTSNHWLIDAAGGEALLLASILIVGAGERASALLRRRWRARWSAVLAAARGGMVGGLASGCPVPVGSDCGCGHRGCPSVSEDREAWISALKEAETC